MEPNILIEGLEEYMEKLAEIEKRISELNELGNELREVIWNMHPRTVIKKPSNLYEG